MGVHNDKHHELTLEVAQTANRGLSDIEAEVEKHEDEKHLQVAEMTDIERSQALAAAQLEDPGVDYRSRRGVTLILILLACLVCGSDTAFDGGGESSQPGWVLVDAYTS
jgi:hypothetical protein